MLSARVPNSLYPVRSAAQVSASGGMSSNGAILEIDWL